MGGSDSWCACTRATCRRCRRAGARSRAAMRRTESMPRSRSRTRSRPMWPCSPCTKPPKIPPPRRAQVTPSQQHRIVPHAALNSLMITPHARTPAHLQTQRAKPKPMDNRGPHGVLKSRAWRCSTLIRGYSLPPSVHQRQAFALIGYCVSCVSCVSVCVVCVVALSLQVVCEQPR